jgi:hypothetical protein
VVGESYNQAAIQAIAEAHPDRGPLDESAQCRVSVGLVPEPDNPHDPNAVRVEIDGRKVGYLSRVDAARYCELGLGRSAADALIVGGWDRGADERGSYGVRLALPVEAQSTIQESPVAPGLTLTPGAFRYDVNGFVESCLEVAAIDKPALIEVRLVPVPDEQAVDVVAGDLVLGSIGGIDAQVVIRGSGVDKVPARVSVRRSYDPGGGNYARLNLAIRIDPASIPRELVSDGCARTPGSYGQHVQAVHKYTKTLRQLCPDATARARALLRSTDGGFQVTIGGADVGTVLGVNAAYAASHAAGDIEVDARIDKRTDGGRGYKVHLAIELSRPLEAP